MHWRQTRDICLIKFRPYYIKLKGKSSKNKVNDCWRSTQDIWLLKFRPYHIKFKGKSSKNKVNDNWRQNKGHLVN
jgi:hypothetical protein